MRERGPSGGGTLRRESPQHGQRPSSQNARVASARSQWPRASHCGLMHCTVKPGRNCISFSLTAVTPLAATARSETRIPLLRTDVGADSGAGRLCCQEEIPQYIVAGLQAAVGTFDARQSRKEETPARV